MVSDHDKRVDDSLQEETATEFDEDIFTENETLEMQTTDYVGLVSGWLGIISSIIAFFLLPLFFSILAIVGGILASYRNHASLGYVAISIAILAFIVRTFITPF